MAESCIPTTSHLPRYPWPIFNTDLKARISNVFIQCKANIFIFTTRKLPTTHTTQTDRRSWTNSELHPENILSDIAEDILLNNIFKR